MAIAETNDLRAYCLDVARRARAASTKLARAKGAQKIECLRRAAKLLREHSAEIMEANKRDVAAAPGFGLTDAEVDRLKLTPARIEAIAKALEEVAGLPDPVGEVMESNVRPNGLKVLKVRVPLGVVFFIYESRPNVTADAAAICVMSGNAVILRGGKEAAHSSLAIVDLLRQALDDVGLSSDAVQLVNTADREAVGHFLSMHEYIDRAADLEMAQRITINSKCQRMGVCNAAESLLVHADVAGEFLPRIGDALSKQKVEIRGDAKTREFIPNAHSATDEDYAAEYLGPIISCRVVGSLDDAIEHINRYGSHHTDAIITGDLAAAQQFTDRVDSSAVMVNASTRFNDGGEFGLGAEIGISTDKFHARGPCGLKELTSYKYVVLGEGQVRE